MRVLCAQAVDGGCEDPLFLYHYSLFYSSQPDADDQKALEIMSQAAVGVIRQHPYPAWVKCMVTSRFQGVLLRRRDLRVGEFAGRLPGDMNPFSSFNRIEPQDHLPAAFLYELADMISRQNENSLVGFWFDKLAVPFSRNAPGSVYLHVLKGSAFGRYALSTGDELREGQPIVRGAEQRQPRLATAQSELEKAYEIDPQLTMVPTEMLRVLFQREAERSEIDKWLKRALEVNPDNFQACSLVLEQLPTDEKLQFGRECFARRNWRGRLVFILVEAHERLANLAQEKAEYWQRPEVWNDLKQVYETQLELFPQAVYDRSYYALLANQCGQWATADRQFKILGDKPSLKVFGSMTSYNYQRKKATKNLGG
jgi:hypothetical protein